jgi:sulfide:quinone oxidoreductase
MVAADMRDLPALISAMERYNVDTVVHTAGLIGSRVAENSYTGATNNILGTINVLEASRLRRLKRVVYVSTFGVYDRAKINDSVVREIHPIGGHNLYTLSGATAILNALKSFRGGRVAILTAAPAYKCPAAPYEAAMLVEAWLRRNGPRDSTEVDFYAAEPGPMGVAGPAVSAAVRQMVESRGIRYHPDHQLMSVDPGARHLAFANGRAAAYDLLIYIPPHRAPAVARGSGLAPEGGWIGVDRGTFETAASGIYAIGDVTSVPLTLGKPLPKAGVFAHRQAEVVAANLAALWTGSGDRRRFDGRAECFLETGDGRAGFGAGDFYAEPLPQVALRGPNRFWHWGKVLFEWKWLQGWF